MADASINYDEWVAQNGEDWGVDSHYLNYPGLLYLHYDKLKPMFDYRDASIMGYKNRIDDESFWISCDGSTYTFNGNTYTSFTDVYIEFDEDNTILYDDDDTIGDISSSGTLELYVRNPESHIIGGYIDNSTGLIDIIDSYTQTVYKSVYGSNSGDVNIVVPLAI